MKRAKIIGKSHTNIPLEIGSHFDYHSVDEAMELFGPDRNKWIPKEERAKMVYEIVSMVDESHHTLDGVYFEGMKPSLDTMHFIFTDSPDFELTKQVAHRIPNTLNRLRSELSDIYDRAMDLGKLRDEDYGEDNEIFFNLNDDYCVFTYRVTRNEKDEVRLISDEDGEDVTDMIADLNIDRKQCIIDEQSFDHIPDEAELAFLYEELTNLLDTAMREMNPKLAQRFKEFREDGAVFENLFGLEKTDEDIKQLKSNAKREAFFSM